jgi:hypothetical protein
LADAEENVGRYKTDLIAATDGRWARWSLELAEAQQALSPALQEVGKLQDKVEKLLRVKDLLEDATGHATRLASASEKLAGDFKAWREASDELVARLKTVIANQRKALVDSHLTFPVDPGSTDVLTWNVVDFLPSEIRQRSK